ncbi:MAG TPA: TIGR00341 family protein [Balneolaceae bacterium]|nr:TIGR00341 family protein [Balneolaceae bacterium]
MPLRQIEVVIPEEDNETFKKLLDDDSVEHFWQDLSESSGYVLKVLVDAAQTEQFLDKAEKLFGEREDYRLVMMSVEATIPRYEENETEEEKEDEKESEPEPWEEPLQGLRVSREELYSDISDGVKLTRTYMAMVILSTIVAALGILRDNTAVVIGAMVIAPLLGPNVGLALSTALADLKLGRLSFLTNITGLLAALAISVALGIFMDVDQNLYQIASRTELHLSDIALALASGAAGVLAYTVGMSAAVIGVMVAVALLPPLVVTGLLAGDMQWELAFFSFILLLTNVICVNLAAVATFIIQGVRPRKWYEAEQAKKTNKIALSIWISLTIVLGLIIYFAG